MAEWGPEMLDDRQDDRPDALRGKYEDGSPAEIVKYA